MPVAAAVTFTGASTKDGNRWEYYIDRLTAALDDAAMPGWDADGYQDALGPHYAASS
ncbi:MAG: hypothetical protein QNM02_02855 [Acidimicrobiia bacterium]|nr:hypothetical protein [Acidimicrobiia bacterium]